MSTQTPVLHLQGIGKLYAVPASEIHPFDSLVWNYDDGKENPVVEIRKPSPQFLAITVRLSDRDYTRRLKVDRLVVVRELSRLYSASYKRMRKDLNAKPQTAAGLSQLLEMFTESLASATDRKVRASLFGQLDAIRDITRETC